MSGPASIWASANFYLIAERAYVLQCEGRYRDAMVLFRGLLTIDPLDTYCRDALSALCLAVGDWGEVVRHSSLLIDASPLNTDALARRCHAHIRLNQFAEADRDLQALSRHRVMAYVSQLQLQLRTAKGSSPTGTR